MVQGSVGANPISYNAVIRNDTDFPIMHRINVGDFIHMRTKVTVITDSSGTVVATQMGDAPQSQIKAKVVPGLGQKLHHTEIDIEKEPRTADEISAFHSRLQNHLQSGQPRSER
jgi:hypothetical protein